LRPHELEMERISGSTRRQKVVTNRGGERTRAQR
jgi:hypothetical protein